MKPPLARSLPVLFCCMAALASAAAPSHVDITWMSITNIYYELGPLGILTDGYFTRIPESEFYGGGGGLAKTHHAYRPDVATITRVMKALGGPRKVTLLFTGHSHFDHSFDTATWSRLTGAPIIGSKTTCLQAMAQGIPTKRCTAVSGGEKIPLADGVTVRVIRWNHSGSSEKNPEQHNPVELDAVPQPDPATGGLHGGVAEDFPNGGGVRAYLFTVDGPQGRFSWFFQNSASAEDLTKPIIVAGVNYGAPIENLQAAMKEAGLERVDLWIGTGDVALAKMVLPVIRPKAFLPVHWDGLWGAFQAGVPKAYQDFTLEALMADQQVKVIKPVQYMDKWRLDQSGVTPLANAAVKKKLGFAANSFRE